MLKAPFPWFGGKTNGGYGNASRRGRGRVNAGRERIWFSPHCLEPVRTRDEQELPCLL